MIDSEKKLQPIRDIIYDYIYITPIEKHVIDTPTFQRLRFISQNSAAYMTYPSNQLSRFSHSLGVMHLGGQMFINAVQNSKPEISESFLEDSKQFLESFFGDKDLSFDEIKNSWHQQYGNICKINVTSTQPDYLFVANFLWQTVRIACLIHDIGHLPYSHLFEYALNNYDERYNKTVATKIKETCISEIKSSDSKIKDIDTDSLLSKAAIHELLGIQILSKVNELLKGSSHETEFVSENKLITRYIFELSVKIFAYNSTNDVIEQKDKVLSCLHEIISSELDADRLDYTLRDARVSGINVAFDYNRILNNIVIYQVKKTGLYKIYALERALSSIEQFFHARYLCYEYIYFHHNVARFDGILEEIIIELLNAMDKSDDVLCKILEEFSFYTWDKTEKKVLGLRREKDKIFRFEYYDDYWLRGLLQKIRHFLHDKVNNNSDYSRIHLLCSTFLFRRTENVISLIKKQSDIDSFFQEFCSYLLSKHHDIYSALQLHIESQQYLNINIELKGDIEKLKHIFALSLQLPDEFKKGFELKIDILRNELRSSGIVLIYKTLKPRVISTRNQVLANNEPKLCVELSPYLRLFEQVPKNSFQHFFSFVQENIKVNNEIVILCKTKTFDCLTDILRDVLILQLQSQLETTFLADLPIEQQKQLNNALISLNAKPSNF